MENIKELYLKVQTEYKDLEFIQEENLEFIQQDSVKGMKKEVRRNSLQFHLLMISFYLITPIALFRLYHLIKQFTANLNFEILVFETGFKIVTTLALAISVIYAFGVVFNIPDKNKSKKLHEDTEQKKTRTINSIIIIYIGIGLAIMFCYLNFEMTRVFLSTYLHVYLYVPLMIISIGIIILTLAALIIFPFEYKYKSNSEFSNNTRFEINYKILKVLSLLSSADNFNVVSTKKLKFITQNLFEIRGLIENYSKSLYGANNKSISTEFITAANGFNDMIERCVIKNTNNTNMLKQELINYFKIFITGDLSELPKSDNSFSFINIKKTKFIHYILFGLYITAPILIIIGLKLIFNVEIDPSILSLLKILYIFWILLGVLTNSHIFNNENKVFLKDLVKTYIGK